MSTKKWREENPDKLRKYRRDYYYKNKQSHFDRNKITENKVRQFVQDNRHPCIICGESEKVCIDFHHLRDKDLDVSQVHKFGSMSRAKEEVEKCVCLCANCHRKVHAGIIQIPV